MSDLLIVSASGSKGAHGRLRFLNHLDAIGAFGKSTVFIPEGADALEAEKWFGRADILHSGQGVGISMAPRYFKYRDAIYNDIGKYIPIVWDVDDNPNGISPWNAAYDTFGEEDVSIVDPDTKVERDLWKDGVGGFDIKRNKVNLFAYRFMLKHADALTTTTEHLRQLLLHYNPNVELVPNTIDFNLFKLRNRPQEDGKVRILYMGGSSHFRDWKSVAPAMKAIVKKYPHVRMVCMGNVHEWAIHDLGEEFVEDRTWSNDYESFALRMGTMGVDLAIAPLYLEDKVDREFSLCKSNLKWLDYGAVGIPCVAQAGIPYCVDMNFGTDIPDIAWDGMLAGSPEEWVVALSVLIENPDMRHLIGDNAYQTVRRHHNAANMGQVTYDMYERIHGYSKWTGETPKIDVREEVCVGGG
jgi:glycosyltransferase involved in cell wall biosynthesis